MKMQMGSNSRRKAGKLFNSQIASNLFRWPRADCLFGFGLAEWLSGSTTYPRNTPRPNPFGIDPPTMINDSRRFHNCPWHAPQRKRAKQP